jgi:hypothetical protein
MCNYAEDSNLKDKIQAEAAAQYSEQKTIGMGVAPMQANKRRSTLAEEAHSAAIHHSEQSQKHYQSAEFLSKHPEFDEFIRLIRSGVIHI